MLTEHLNLNTGDALQLQPITQEGVANRYTVRVVGYLPERSLVVTAPENKGKVMLVREGQRYAVRVLIGGSVFGFVASVLRSCVKPYPYLHLSYPTEIESIVVRNARRVDISAPVRVRNSKDPSDKEASWRSAELVDLSSTGALLTSPEMFTQKDDMLEVSMCLTVQDVEENLNLAALVRNAASIVPEQPDEAVEHRYGVQFRSVNRLQQLIIHGFVLEHLVNDAALI